MGAKKSNNTNLAIQNAAMIDESALFNRVVDEHERLENEETPIWIILCASANRKKVEMMNMDLSGIAVAEYWTELPPKAVFEGED